jgi:hypothetical protein
MSPLSPDYGATAATGDRALVVPRRAEPAQVDQVRRWALSVVVVIGVGLAAAPVAFDMFSRAPRGATMLAGFRPFMTEPRLSGFQQDIGRIDAAVTELHPTPAAAHSGAYAALQQQWPQIHTTMSGLLVDVRANVPNYRAVAALPSFRLFPWFFVIPGVLIAVLAGFALTRPTRARGIRPALVVLGLGLVLAPVVFQMFTRAPKGGRMMSDFTTIETTTNVERIQGYFATIASGQGAIRLDVEPRLRAAEHLSAAQFAARYPATTALDAQWVHILNDMTPMIGAMSDNVGNYDAIAALPPFPLFPWFFAIPGVLVVAAALGAVHRSTSPFSQGAP